MGTLIIAIGVAWVWGWIQVKRWADRKRDDDE